MTDTGRGRRLACFVLLFASWSLQAQAQGEPPAPKVGFAVTAWYGNTNSTSPFDASTDPGPGLAARVDLRLGRGRLGLEFGVLHLTGSISFPPIFDELPDYVPTAPLKSEHLLVSYEVGLGRVYLRPGIGFARHRTSSFSTNTGVSSLSGEWGGALSLAAGYRVAQLRAFDVSAEALWRHSRGEDSTSPRNFLGLGIAIALR